MTTTPDANDFCTATEFNSAVVNDPGREANPTTGTTAIAATKISYKFNNIAVYAAPNAPGTPAQGRARLQPRRLHGEVQGRRRVAAGHLRA